MILTSMCLPMPLSVTSNRRILLHDGTVYSNKKAITFMEPSLIDIATKVFGETSIGVDLSKYKPIYIAIKDNKITVSLSINSLKKADECMLLLPYRWDNTVPSYSGYGTVTFRNTLRKLVSIDNNGNVIQYRYGDSSSLWIGCDCHLYGAVVKLFLNWNNTTLLRCGRFFPTTEDFHKIWNLYQDSKRMMNIMENVFDGERAEMQSEIDELTKKCSDLKKKNKSLRDTIKRLKDSSDSER